MKAIKTFVMFQLARLFGTPFTRELPVKDGVKITISGYHWRGVNFANDLQTKIVNPQAHRNAMRQQLGGNEEPRIVVPGRRR